MREFQHIVTTPDGIRLAVREYLPDDGAAHRHLLFVHGACEHGGRYAEFAKAATERGWRALIPDHRGHGLSTGPRVHIHRFEEYLDDLRLILRHFSLKLNNTAIVGHSLGGLIVARLLESQMARTGRAGGVSPLILRPSSTPPAHFVAAACLLSPYLGLRIRVDRFTLLVGRILERVWPTYRFRSRVKSADLATDPEYLERRRQDTLIQRFVTARWFFTVQRAVRQAHTDAHLVQTPIFILQGEQDHVVEPQATQAWFELTGSEDKSIQMLPGHLHELLQEPDREQTTRIILDWLDSRVAKKP